MKKKVKWIKVRYIGTANVSRKGFWVSEKNPYFNWYKESEFYEVLKEVER